MVNIVNPFKDHYDYEDAAKFIASYIEFEELQIPNKRADSSHVQLLLLRHEQSEHLFPLLHALADRAPAPPC